MAVFNEAQIYGYNGRDQGIVFTGDENVAKDKKVFYSLPDTAFNGRNICVAYQRLYDGVCLAAV